MKKTREVFGYFVRWKIVILVFAYIGAWIIPLNPTFSLYPDLSLMRTPYLMWIWANFDGIHYLSIAQFGYQLLQQPFFPFYPLLIHIGMKLFHLDVLMLALLISHIAFFISLIVCAYLLEVDKKLHLRYVFFLFLLAFPTSFFYGAVYTDAVFFLFASLTILFARKKHFFFASIWASLATLTRLNGLALFFFLLIEYSTNFENEKETWNVKKILRSLPQKFSLKRILKEKIFSTIFIPLSFLGYVLYIQTVFKQWRLIFSTMEIWKQNSFTFPPQVIWRYLKLIATFNFRSDDYWITLLEFVFVAFYLFILYVSIKKIRFSYWVFFTLSMLIPWFTGTFAGMPRYGLHLYPFFLAVAVFVQKSPKALQVALLLLYILLLFFYVAFFTRGYFVA